MIVSGSFDASAGSNDPLKQDIITGLFCADAGSNVTTNLALWDVQNGGVLDVAAGGTLTVPVAGTLMVEAGGAVTIEGHMIVSGLVDPPTIIVQGNGMLSIPAGGQVTVTGLVASGSAMIDAVGTVSAGTLSLLGQSQLQQAGNNVSISAPSSETIQFAPLANKAAGDPAFTVSASINSGLAVQYSIVSGNAYASISGNTITILGPTPAGTFVTVRASQPGNASFSAATPVDQSFTISGSLLSRTDQLRHAPAEPNVQRSIVHGERPRRARRFPCSSASSPATPTRRFPAARSRSTARLPSARSSPSGPASPVTAPTPRQPRSTRPSPSVKPVSRSRSAASQSKAFGDSDFALNATASSPLGVTYSIVSGGACASISGSTAVRLLGATPVGTVVTVRASQGGNANYAAAPTVDQSFSIAKQNQTISFAAIGNKTLGDADFPISAAASSGLTVSFTAGGSATLTQVGGTWSTSI